MTEAPSIADQVLTAVRSGDGDRVVQLVTALKQRERTEVAKPLISRADSVGFRRGVRGLIRPELDRPVRSAWTLAMFGSATARQISSNLLVLDDPDRLVAVIQTRDRRFLESLRRSLLDRDRWFGESWRLLRLLYQRGLIERPAEPAYIIGTVSGVAQDVSGTSVGREGENPVLRGLLDDPDLLGDEIWELFQHDEAIREIAWFVNWSPEEGTTPKDQSELLWATALRTLADDGRIDRDRVLDTILGSLLLDFSPGSLQTLGRFWEQLRPTDLELDARVGAFLQLLTNASPTSQRVGVDALASVSKRGSPIDPGALAASAAVPLSGEQKHVAMALLRMLDRVAADPAHAVVALRGVTAGLGHRRADVQERAVDVLTARWPADASEQRLLIEEIEPWMDTTSGAVRPRLVGLTGAATARDTRPGDSDAHVDRRELASRIANLPEDIGRTLGLADALAAVRRSEPPPPCRLQPTDAPLLARGDPVTPILDLDELIEVCAALLEGVGDAITIERALDGISRQCDESSRDPRATSALLKRAKDHHDPDSRWNAGRGYAFANDFAHLLVVWLTRAHAITPRWLRSFPEHETHTDRTHRSGVVVALRSRRAGRPVAMDGGGFPGSAYGFVATRMLEIGSRAARGDARPLLALPSHDDGWLDPAVLAERLDRYDAGGRRVEHFDAVQALLRLPMRPGAAQPFRDRGGSFADAATAVLTNDVSTGSPLAASIVRPPDVRDATVVCGMRKEQHWQDSTPSLAYRFAPAPVARRDDPIALLALRLDPPEYHTDPWWQRAQPVVGGFDHLGVAAASGALVRSPDLLFAAASCACVREDGTDIGVVLAHALDGDVPLGTGGHHAIAVAACSKEARYVGAAVDVLIASAEDGRLDAVLLGGILATFIDQAVVKPTRLGPPLKDVARTSAVATYAVWRTMVGLFARLESSPPGLHVPLEVLHETGAELALPIVDDAARATLQRLATGSSKRAKLARSVLAVEGADAGVDGRADAVRWTMLERLGERAERWIAAGERSGR